MRNERHVTVEAKPCPFCGSANILEYTNHGYKYQEYYLYCQDCGATGPRINIEAIDKFYTGKATLKWNRREGE